MTKQEIFKTIKGKMIVSCQALPGEPLYTEDTSVMALMARAAKEAGSPAIRTSSIRDVIAVKAETGLPVIGLIKQAYEGYEAYITPTMKEVDALVTAGADMVALDCTLRTRGDGRSVNDFIAEIKEKYPEIILMADIATYEEGINAWKAGVACVSTTMSGNTSYSPRIDGPDLQLVKDLSTVLDIPVIGEGRVHYPSQLKQMFEAGAYAVVVGGAITRPLEIARRFMAVLETEML